MEGGIFINKVAVIYKSKYGSTKKYAEWISSNLNADLFERSVVNAQDLLAYDTIVFGGGLYAGGIDGISLITKNFDTLKNKNLIIFTVGLASTDDKEIFKPIIEKACTQEMCEKIQFFHMRGAIDYKKLNFVHKPMMAMLKTALSKKKPDELSEDDKIMLSTYGKPADFTDIKTIEPLVSYIKSLSK